MIDLQIMKRGWELLDSGERANAMILLAIVSLAALSSAVMVGSIMPFLYVLARPGIVKTDPILSTLYETFGFTSEFHFLYALGLASLAVILVTGALQVLRAYAVARFAMMRMHSLSCRLLASFLSQPYEFFLSQHSAELSTQILSEAQAVVGQFFRPAAELIAGILTVLAVIALLVFANPVVALITFGTLGVLYSTVFLLSRRVVARAGERRLKANQARYKIAGEALGGVKYVKLSGHERTYISRYEAPSRAFAKMQVIIAVLGEVPHYAMQSIAFGGGIVFCLALLDPTSLGSGEALGGILPIAGLFAAAAMRILPEFSKIYHSLTQLQAAGSAVTAIHADLAGKIVDAPAKRPEPLRLREALRLEGVTYKYPASEGRAGIEDVSVVIRAGEKVGIVGATGAGKTTFADVILGLLLPQSGHITVDGILVHAANVRSWQRSVGYVPQEIYLTDASIAENIAIGEQLQNIDLDRVRRAAVAARIDGVVDSLPGGYRTAIGERGVRLSGGQRQRLGIARALYTDADLILFDEATSALDTMTEREVMAAIDSLSGEKTLLMIAHRLSTLKVCDRIILMRAGAVANVGTWDELVRSDEEFRIMAKAAAVA